jgi:hypothetical protein
MGQRLLKYSYYERDLLQSDQISNFETTYQHFEDYYDNDEG